MKKATFLFVILGLLYVVFTPVAHAESFSFNDTTLSLEQVMVEGDGQIKVTKGGSSPFVKTIGIDGYMLEYEGITAFQNYYVVYGYSIGGPDQRDYSGFYFVLDSNGELLMSEIVNDGYMESINEAYQIGDILILELTQYRDEGYGPILMKYQFFVFNKSLTLTNDYTIKQPLKQMIVEENRLLGRYRGSILYDFGILSDGSIMWKDDDIGVIDEAVYDKEVCLNAINSFVLDGDTYDQGTCISTIGLHYLQYQNLSFTFTIEPTIQGVEEGMVYYDPVQINASDGYMTLNGDGYSNFQEISEVGTYTFSIEGVNNYRKDINFEIGAVVEGITNNTVYDEPVTLTFTGQGYLNNQFIKSPYTVDHPGEYIFKIKGDQGYIENYYFEVEEKEEEFQVLDLVQKVDVFVLGSILVFGIFMVKRKK